MQLAQKVQIVITRTPRILVEHSLQLSIQLKLFTNESFTFLKPAFDLYLLKVFRGNIQETIRQDVQASSGSATICHLV